MAQGGGRVAAIEPCSPAAEAGLLPGDCICAVSDRPLRDRIDFEFLTAEDNPILTISRAGKVTQITVMKDAEEPTGVSFEDDTFDGIRRCRNHCRFCFVDAQPAGLRPSLYVKDDDFRYSFIYGSFLTLTNLNEEDWARLAEQRLSPLYISVHSTNDQLRALLLGRKSTPSIVAQLRRLAALGITLHTQVVVCPGLNDGQELERTLDDLQTLWPAVQSVAIVPVGITRFSRDPLIRTHSEAGESEATPPATRTGRPLCLPGRRVLLARRCQTAGGQPI